MKEMSDLPSLEISCGTCSRNRHVPVCLGGGSYCRFHKKSTDGIWISGQPRPDEPCLNYNPSRDSFIGVILGWLHNKQERKTSKEVEG